MDFDIFFLTRGAKTRIARFVCFRHMSSFPKSGHIVIIMYNIISLKSEWKASRPCVIKVHSLYVMIYRQIIAYEFLQGQV